MSQTVFCLWRWTDQQHQNLVVWVTDAFRLFSQSGGLLWTPSVASGKSCRLCSKRKMRKSPRVSAKPRPTRPRLLLLVPDCSSLKTSAARLLQTSFSMFDGYFITSGIQENPKLPWNTPIILRGEGKTSESNSAGWKGRVLAARCWREKREPKVGWTGVMGTRGWMGR